jgi:hypothetical protein
VCKITKKSTIVTSIKGKIWVILALDQKQQWALQQELA